MSATPENCFFLTTEIVIEVHGAAIAGFGGSPGLRDRALLESAVAAPQATFGGASVYADLVEMGAAYLFYLCRNHPFVDGNERVALFVPAVPPLEWGCDLRRMDRSGNNSPLMLRRPSLTANRRPRACGGW